MDKEESSIKSVNKLSIFSKTPPKITEVKGGRMYEFTDILSVSTYQEIKTKNVGEEDLKKFFKGLRDSLGHNDSDQSELPGFEEA